jgi:hypothetical protein
MALAGFEPTISADERLQAYALDRAVAGPGNPCLSILKKFMRDEIHMGESDDRKLT